MRLLMILVLISVSSSCKEASARQQTGNAVVDEAKDIDLAESILKPRPYQFTLPRDPFKPLFGKLSLMSVEEQGEEAPPQFKVTGILIKKDSPLALLDVPSKGTFLVREGAKLDNYTVKKIESKKIILEKSDKTFVLQIGEEK